MFLSASRAGPADGTPKNSATAWHRLPQRPASVVCGTLLFFAAIGVLAWNEWREVSAFRGPGQPVRNVSEVAASVVDPAYDGRLVHLTGVLNTIAPLADEAMGFSQWGLVRLRRTVEMFQWREIRQSSAGGAADISGPGRPTYSYAKRWSETPTDSRSFTSPLRHENPPMPFRSQAVVAQDAMLGARNISPTLLESFDAFEPVALPSAAPSGFVRTPSGFFKGLDPDAPEIGDLRVSFAGVPVQPVSVVAEQHGARLAPYRTASGAMVGVVAPGAQGAAALMARDKPRGTLWAWALRLAAFVALTTSLIGVAPVFSLRDDASDSRHLALVLVTAASLTFMTIGSVWLIARPLVGIALLVAAVVIALASWRLRRTPHAIAPVLPVTAAAGSAGVLLP